MYTRPFCLQKYLHTDIKYNSGLRIKDAFLLTVHFKPIFIGLIGICVFFFC